MLEPEYLAELPEEAAALWRAVEDDILCDVAARLARLGELDELTPTAAWRLWRAAECEALGQDIVKRLAQISQKSEAAIRAAVQKGCSRALQLDDAIHRAAGRRPGAPNDSPALRNLLQAGVRQTLGSWRNLTRTTAATVAPQFAAAMDRAWLQVTSGAFSYDEAIRGALDALAGSLKTVTYPSGHKDRLEVAVRRCVVTGTNQAAGRLQLARAAEMGCGHVEVSAHAGARSDGSRGPRDHAWWQGKVYRLGDAEQDATQDGESGAEKAALGAGESNDSTTGQEGLAVQNRGRWRDVTREYLDAATPGVGSVAYDSTFDKGRHQNEVAFSEWLQKKFGGDLRLLDEVNQDKIHTPDYVWRKRLWDLKTVTTEKAADSAIRHGLKQICQNPGGIFLDYRNQEIDLQMLQSVIDSRMRHSKSDLVDIMVVLSDEVIKVLRYKK